jgi:hypothetical protein
MGFLARWLAGAFAPRKVMRVGMPSGAIRHDNTSIQQQRGWRRTGKRYTGPFATPYGTWLGRVENAGDILRCYIRNPPTDVVSLHEKWSCFARESADGWWRIHLAVSPVDHDVSSVILYVERVLIESHRRAGKA